MRMKDSWPFVDVLAIWLIIIVVILYERRRRQSTKRKPVRRRRRFGSFSWVRTTHCRHQEVRNKGGIVARPTLRKMFPVSIMVRTRIIWENLVTQSWNQHKPEKWPDDDERKREASAVYSARILCTIIKPTHVFKYTEHKKIWQTILACGWFTAPISYFKKIWIFSCVWLTVGVRFNEFLVRNISSSWCGDPQVRRWNFFLCLRRGKPCIRGVMDRIGEEEGEDFMWRMDGSYWFQQQRHK